KEALAVAKLTREERESIARRRIISVLRQQGVANLRTLEQKIADAGPNDQRIQPHIITPAKNALVDEGRIIQFNRNGQWFHLADESPDRVARRMAELQALWSSFTTPQIVRRTGQALEIAIFRALVASPSSTPFGGFSDLGQHDDATLYTKREIQDLNGLSLGQRALDFIIACGGDYCGIEAKNIRPWLYPHDRDITEAIEKARILDVVPVIIARRIHFSTFKVLTACGVIVHQTFNQRMATTDAELAAAVAHKDALGYHDIRVGNDPDPRLTRFIDTHLPPLVPQARTRLRENGDLLDAYAKRLMAYPEFAGRLRRRRLGLNEDRDGREDPDVDPYDEE
ncbi:MAG TPA: hypothetical protein VIJ94_20485, partial [Caulobacteraceae bacterium]